MKCLLYAAYNSVLEVMKALNDNLNVWSLFINKLYL